ncbi:MAG: BTAD domain-containing putative transcriptional regulator [Hyphomicrobiaceae bacterium]
MRIRILGGLDATSPAGEPLRLPTRKTALVLAALVLAGEKGVRRQAVSDAFWAERGEAQARSSLRQALAALRRAFSQGDDRAVRIEGDLETLHLAARADDVDVWRFERLIGSAGADDLAKAAALYQGDVLAGIPLPEPLDEWFAPHQRSYRQKALLLVERLSLLTGSDLRAVEAECQALTERLLAADAAAEEAHRALIRLYQHQGRLNAAIRQYELCRETLRRELDAEPEAQTEALMAGVRDARAEVGNGDAAHAASPTALTPDREQPSIIVMPFDNLSGTDDEYFVDGVVEEITSALSRVREFFVIARQSAFTYKGRFVDVREVGRELSVNYVVEGTVRRGGDRLRISVQLVDAETRNQLWSDRYEGATHDIFAFQDEIAAQVAGAIYPAVRNAEIAVARSRPPASVRAYDLVLQAYPKIWSQSSADNAQAIAILSNAIATCSDYGRAHALLAWCHSQDQVYLWSANPEASRVSAGRAVDAAAPLIGDDPTALAAVGAALSQSLDDLPRAASYVDSALTLDPNNAWAWSRSAWIAIYQDEPDRARDRFERSLALSPLDPMAFNQRIGIAMTFGYKGEYAQSAKLLQEVLNKHPNITWTYRQLAFVSAMAGDLDTARDAIKKLRAAHPGATIALMKRAHPARHSPRIFDLMLKGWRAAGLPET